MIFCEEAIELEMGESRGSAGYLVYICLSRSVSGAGRLAACMRDEDV